LTGRGGCTGQLIDVSDTPEAKEAGFRIPICLTVGVHALVQVPQGHHLRGLLNWHSPFSVDVSVSKISFVDKIR